MNRIRQSLTYLGLTGLLLLSSVTGRASVVPGQLVIKPTVTINQASGQADPTNLAPIRFTAVFSKNVTGFTSSDVSLSGTAPGALVTTVTGSGKKYNVAVTGMTGSGTVVANVVAGGTKDSVGNVNKASTSKDNSVTYDVTPPAVTINQAVGQADPTNTSPIRFTIVFSEAVTGFTASDITLSGTATGNLAKTITGSGPTYNVTVTGMTGSGTVIASIAAGIARDRVGNDNTASTSTDNTVTYDVTAPTVTVNQAIGQADPTTVSPINFTVVFSEIVTDFTSSDVTLSGTAPGTLTKTLTGSGTTYNLAVSGMTGSGTVIANIAAGVAHDAVGNNSAASTSTDNTVTFIVIPPDVTVPTVTINQASGQADPTNVSPINFTVVFSETVTGFTSSDVTLGGTVSGTLTAIVTGSGSTYNVAVSGMTGNGTVTATIAAGAAQDGASNNSAASTSTDNTVTYDATAPTVTINQAISQADPTTVSPINFTVVFSETVTGFTSSDVTLSGTAPGTLITTVTGSGTTYNVAVTGMTGSGTVIANVIVGAIQDGVGNNSAASTSTDNTVTFTVIPPDVTAPTVTIDQAFNQSDPTNDEPIRFTVIFSETITGFTASDVSLSGTATGTLITTVTGSGPTYNVAVTGMSGSGTVIANVAAGVAQDGGGNSNTTSTSTDNTVTFDVAVTPPAFLGMATTFGAFGSGAGMTNQGTFTVVNGDIGTTGASTLITGFHDSTGDRYMETPSNIGDVTGRIYTDAPPPVIFVSGGPFGGNAQTKAIADEAAADALTAYNELASLPTTAPDPSAAGELSGLTLAPGVYKSAGGSFNILPAGTLTLDAQGDPNAVWVFQMGSSLNVGAIGAGLTPSRVVFKDGIGEAGNVYWQVGSSATINTGAQMVGTIIASAGVTFSTSGQVILTNLEGRALSLNASVTMVNTIINVP